MARFPFPSLTFPSHPRGSIPHRALCGQRPATRSVVFLTMTTVNHGEAPYTTDDVSLDELTLPDQIIYMVYNGTRRRTQIAERATEPEDWTRDMVEDMVEFGELVEVQDQIRLPEGERLEDAEQEEQYETVGQASDLGSEPEDDGTEEPDEPIAPGAPGEAFPSSDTDLPQQKMEAALEEADVDADELVSELEADDDSEAEQATEATGEPAEADDGEVGGSAPAEAADTSDAPDASEGTSATEVAQHVDHTPEPEQTAEARDATPDDTLGGEPAEPEHTGTGRLPVNRDYDWEEETVARARVEDYVSSNNEYEDIMTEVNTRLETGKLPRFRLVGPSGCGKTSVAENAARDLDDQYDEPVPEFTVQCHDGLRPNNLLGMPTYVGDETWWSDGPITKALLASQHGPVVLIFDEINRTTSRTLGVIMSVLDHQCRVTLNARGGEVVRGNPMNLIVFSTMNEGSGYVVNQMDHAQVRRLGNTFETNYIGMNNPQEEAELIADRTPLEESVARPMVDAANDVRQKAQSDSTIKTGVPTSTMLDWARTAWAHRGTDADGGALVKAGHLSVVNPFYRDSDEVRSTVVNTIETHVRDMSVYPDEERPLTDISGVGDAKAEALRSAGYVDVAALQEAGQRDLASVEGIGAAMASKIKADVGDGDDAPDDEIADAAWLVCETCGWSEEAEAAPEEVRATMACPDCSHTIRPRENPA